MKKWLLPLALALGLSLALPLPALAVERMKGYDYGDGGENYTVEQALEAPNADVVLLRRHGVHGFLDQTVRDYELWLCWEDDYKKLILPSTVEVEGQMSLMYPTDRAPDSLTLSEDGSTLTYVYSFEDALYNAHGQPLHEAGSYTYTVDLATGELDVTHEAGDASLSSSLGAEGTTFVDVSPEDWFAPYVDVCVEAGLMKGTGEGKFSPSQVLSGYECAVLALRLHNLGRGGDGTFEKAPWDWGYVFMTFPDGTMKEGYLSDETAWDWTRLHRADDGHFGFRLDTEEEKEWGRSMDYQAVTLSVNGVEYTGELHLAGEGFLYFDFANMDDYHAIHCAYVPTPNAWWRDAWYYAEQNGLTNLLMAGNDERWTFAERMAAVTDLPAINDIQGLPDTGVPDTLELYRAGVLTGSDEYGTFHGFSTMTRAEGAAICARILWPELRVSFSPKPLETYENYTLTYLREDGVRKGGPYRAQHSMDLVVPDPHSLMRLDGVELSIPDGYEVQTVGDGLAGLAKWDDDVFHFGLIDSQGRFQAATREEVYENPRLAYFPYTSDELHNGYESRGAFFNAQGEQVTPTFDWAGTINAEGAGFVGMDRKIYRIQFEK